MAELNIPDISGPDHGLTPETFGGSKLTQESIDLAVATIRRLAGWHVFPQRTETIRCDSPGDPMVLLPTKCLVGIESIKVDGETVVFTDEDWSPDGMVWIDTLTPARNGRPRRIEATITHGYESAGDLIGLVAAMAGRATAPAQGYTVGRINVGAPGAITPQSTEWRIIDEIKLGPVP